MSEEKTDTISVDKTKHQGGPKPLGIFSKT
jgi:hypothetical protein